MKRKFIIDTDTASDDAVALIMAANHPKIQIEAITVVAGNVSLKQGLQNAMYTLKLCETTPPPPVYAGISRPLLRKPKTADHVHGKDGMSDIGLNLSGFVPEKEHAVQTILEKINQFQNEVTLVCLAPLTNIAVALLLDKTITNKVKECIIMGGVGQGRGNVTPLSEYNFWSDPEAAKIVFESGMPIKMVGWDISREYAVFDNDDANALRRINTPLANFAVDIQKVLIEYAQEASKLKGFDLPDPIAMAIALDETVAIETKEAFVSILTNDDDSRGQSVMDYTGASLNKPNATIVQKVDRKKFLQMLYSALSKRSTLPNSNEYSNHSAS
ncbi:nucleoside hydrolase [Aquimarina algiphila]|uniref:nucleoside hydrolase n=1 Tax=Aquimarina algiphila TaxID=2047982 RepID=UPI0024900CD6|nr:nucleoside hydrolase [Aquimarina algiphila]